MRQKTESKNGSFDKSTLGVVTSNEITSIDNRIKYCLIENPEQDCLEFYVKIWFNYQMKNKDLQTDGRQEFVAITKLILINEIQDFMKVSKDGWCIL